jgi:hypothetical protein
MRKLSVCLNQEINSGRTANLEKPPPQKAQKKPTLFSTKTRCLSRGAQAHDLIHPSTRDTCGVEKVWEQKSFTTKTRPCHCGLAIYIKKYLKAKEELMETQIFHQPKI